MLSALRTPYPTIVYHAKSRSRPKSRGRPALRLRIALRLSAGMSGRISRLKVTLQAECCWGGCFDVWSVAPSSFPPSLVCHCSKTHSHRCKCADRVLRPVDVSQEPCLRELASGDRTVQAARYQVMECSRMDLGTPTIQQSEPHPGLRPPPERKLPIARPPLHLTPAATSASAPLHSRAP